MSKNLRMPISPGSPEFDRRLKEFIKNTPGKPIKRHIEMVEYGSFWHEKVTGNEETIRMFNEVVRSYKKTLAEAYLRKVPEFIESTDNILDPAGKEFDVGIFANRMNRMIRASDDEYVYIRVRCPNYIIYLTAWNTDEFDEKHVTYSITAFDIKNQTTRGNIFDIYLKDHRVIDFTRGPLVIAKRRKDAEAVFKSLYESYELTRMGPVNRRYAPDYALMVAAQDIIVKYGKEVPGYPINSMWIPDHTDIEMAAMEAAIDDLGLPCVISSIIAQKAAGHSLNIFNKLSTLKPPPIVTDAKLDKMIPLVDLSKKEMDYVERYMERMQYLGTSAEKTEVDLVEKMLLPRYGETLRFNFVDEENAVHECTTSYAILPEDEYLRVWIRYQVNESDWMYVMVDFDHIRSFHPTHSLVNISVDVVQDPSEYHLRKSATTIVFDTPSFMRSNEGIISKVIEMIATHIIIHDRPNRTRMVRCYQRVPKEKDPNKPEDEAEFVIRRILKPAKEAKQMVSLSDGSTPLGHDREYTMAEWERVGHLRRIPGTDRTVWIEPTTCVRHLPLSDKEIHIKL